MYKCQKCGATTKPRQKRLVIRTYREKTYPCRYGEREGSGREIKKEEAVCPACYNNYTAQNDVVI